MIASHRATVPTAAATYFGPGAPHPTVEYVFDPARGWVSARGWTKRISPSWARRLRGEGITHVALRSGRRVADFGITELTR